MKFCVFAFVCLVGLSTVSCQWNPEFYARRVARQCTREHKLSYEVASKLSKGDFSDDSTAAKCFVRCFADKIGFFDKEGKVNKDELLKYVKYVVPSEIEVRPILDDCEAKTEVVEDRCEYAFRAYRCFWDGVNAAIEKPAVDGAAVRFSLYDVLGFNRLYDEEEIASGSEDVVVADEVSVSA